MKTTMEKMIAEALVGKKLLAIHSKDSVPEGEPPKRDEYNEEIADACVESEMFSTTTESVLWLKLKSGLTTFAHNTEEVEIEDGPDER